MKTEEYFEEKLRLIRVKMGIQVAGVLAEAAIAIALWVWLRGGL